MSFGPYAKTKDSGYPWLGEIPAHWDVRRLKRMCDINPSKRDIGNLNSQTLVSFLPMELIGDDGSVQLVDTRVVEEVQKGYTYFQDGDVLVAKITPCFENGKGALVQGLVNGIGFGTTELHVLRPRDSLDPRFLWYITASYGFRHTGTAMMEGAAGQKRVPERFVKDFPIAVPPREEQKTILRFLDGSLESISDALAKSRRMIELLHEYRQALITQAVTKGLDPNVPMKDSGIPWLGEIPEHWRVLPLKRVVCHVSRGATPSYVDHSTVPVINQACIYWDGLKLENVKYHDPNVAVGNKGYVLPGDLLINSTGTGTLGRAVVFVEDERRYIADTHVTVVRVENDKYEVKYLHQLLSTPPYQAYVYSALTSGATNQIELSREGLRNLLLPMPPLEEQQAICDFLEDRVRAIGLIIEQQQLFIGRLQEYRQALITAAVTGKIDVRRDQRERTNIQDVC